MSFAASRHPIVCLPFLDTDDPEGEQIANEVLGDRGYPRWTILLLRALAGPGLWIQLFLWEEWSLTASDVYYGYSLLLIPATLLSAVWSFKLAAILATVAGILFWRAVVGWRRHRASRDVPKDVE